MSDRTEREKQLDWLYRLKSDLKIFIPKDFHLAEFEQSLDYAISSIKTDLKYDLLYEETREKIPINLHITEIKKHQSDFSDLGKDNNVTTKDCISRVDARKAIIDHQYSDSFCEEHNIDHSINTGMALIALSDLPSVTPIRPKGHWIEQIDHEENCRTLICSNCDRPALHDGDSIWKHKFCPHCGADMRKVEE